MYSAGSLCSSMILPVLQSQPLLYANKNSKAFQFIGTLLNQPSRGP